MVQLTQEMMDLLMEGHQTVTKRLVESIEKYSNGKYTADKRANQAEFIVKKACEIIDVPLGKMTLDVDTKTISAEVDFTTFFQRLHSLVATEKKYSELRRKKK